MPFGKHKGAPIASPDDNYLLWLLCQPWLRDPVLSAINAEVDARKAGHVRRDITKPDPLLTRKIIDSGYKALALQHHPDRGGDLRVMQSLNNAVSWLREQIEVLT
jgi:hypothetical protein